MQLIQRFIFLGIVSAICPPIGVVFWVLSFLDWFGYKNNNEEERERYEIADRSDIYDSSDD